MNHRQREFRSPFPEAQLTLRNQPCVRVTSCWLFFLPLLNLRYRFFRSKGKYSPQVHRWCWWTCVFNQRHRRKEVPHDLTSLILPRRLLNLWKKMTTAYRHVCRTIYALLCFLEVSHKRSFSSCVLRGMQCRYVLLGGTKGLFISFSFPWVRITIMMLMTMREKSITVVKKKKKMFFFPYGQTVSFVIASSLCC